MAKPSVFISHSAKEPEAEAALSALAERLAAAGFEVLLDRERLRGGDAWRAEIRRWMDACRATVLLLSPAALDSPHVLKEVTLMVHRWQRGAGFVMVPIRVAGLAGAKLREDPWRTTQLPEAQALTWDGRTIADEVADRLAPVLAGSRPDAPEVLLELALAEKLQSARADTIRTAAATLEIAPDEWDLELDPSRVFAQRLLESRHRFQVEALVTLAHVRPDLGEHLYEHVAPHGIVDCSAARALAQRVTAEAEPRVVGINSHERAICDLYVRRAHFRWRLHPLARAWSDDAVRDVLEEVREVVALALGYLADELPVDFAELDAALVGEPVVVLLPEGLSPGPVVAALRERLPHLPLLARCSAREDLEQRLRDARYIEPELAEGEDARLLAEHRNARRQLHRLSQVGLP